MSGLREHHAARFVVRMRQGEKAGRPEVLALDLLRRHGGELLPGHVLGQPHAHALLHRLAAGHGDALGRAVGQVVALREQRLMALGELRLLLLQAFDQRGKSSSAAIVTAPQTNSAAANAVENQWMRILLFMAVLPPYKNTATSVLRSASHPLKLICQIRKPQVKWRNGTSFGLNDLPVATFASRPKNGSPLISLSAEPLPREAPPGFLLQRPMLPTLFPNSEQF